MNTPHVTLFLSHYVIYRGTIGYRSTTKICSFARFLLAHTCLAQQRAVACLFWLLFKNRTNPLYIGRGTQAPTPGNNESLCTNMRPYLHSCDISASRFETWETTQTPHKYWTNYWTKLCPIFIINCFDKYILNEGYLLSGSEIWMAFWDTF